ncbi:hypothetical protein Tcan_12105 [Toxocara canis]|uniref:Uncharacterized protein n=1 Tax=Toxocara canis TaxID=6265 RepID=A0A0B2UPP0_TOXCA|nr:hypothetical protein Tcan_12105 [Toxocara canis]
MNRRRNVRRILSEERPKKRPKPAVADTRNLSKWYIMNVHCQTLCYISLSMNTFLFCFYFVRYFDELRERMPDTMVMFTLFLFTAALFLGEYMKESSLKIINSVLWCQKRCWFGYFLIVTECLDYAVNKRLRITYEEGSATLCRFLVISSQLAVRYFFLRYLAYLRTIRIRTPTESEDEEPRFFYP